MDNSNSNDLPEINKLWDYSKPAETERAFRELIPKVKALDDMAYYAELNTQLARTQSLQNNFAEAYAILDYVQTILTPEMTLATVRYWLERGRSLNSDGQKEEAVESFLIAYELALQNQYDFHAVDAAHMLGIAEANEKQVEWNLLAIESARQSEDEKARNWLGALYNNTGWSYHELEQYPEALDYFKQALEWHKKKGNESNILIAKWALGRSLRSLSRNEEAIKIHQELEKELKEKGLPADGYVHEELGENFYELGRAREAGIHFGKAYELLSKDDYLRKNEPERLKRLQELAID